MSVKVRVVVTRNDLPGDGVARLMQIADVVTWEGAGVPSADELVALCGDAPVMLAVNGDPLGAEVLRRLPSLRLLAVASTGYNSVDVHAARDLGIAVTHTPGVLAETVADLTIGLIISARRRIVEAALYVREGLWTDNNLWTLLGLDVHGATLGILGFGAIGKALARRAVGFDMQVVHFDPVRREDANSRWLPLDELLRQADIVSLHLPLTAETRGSFGERELRLMKPTATLVNTSRGSVVDEDALVRALREGWIHSAGLDVQAREPNSDVNDRLLALSNCVVLPHIGSATLAARAGMVDMAVNSVREFLQGRPVTSIVAELRTGNER